MKYVTVFTNNKNIQMKVALIGASGFVGTAVLKELLQRGHEVKAIARNTESIAAQKSLTIIKVDATDTASLVAAIKGEDIVISAYNAGWTNPNYYSDFLEGSKAIQKAVKEAGVKRLIAVGGAGSLFIDGAQIVDGPDFPAEYKTAATAARDYLNVIKEEKELDWVVLSPAIEMNQGTSGIRKGTYRTAKDSPVFNAEGRSILSVEDLAVVLVDEIEQHKYSRERFTAAY
jgi:putative NADH-flavin reductase